ncbi:MULTISPECIES: DEAD/DEAH box helicase [unclassified Oceanispirochaeta]|uniref:DEAD/DEAH box helicase n=1 Tax=unclassified Oceanispirochaeta TaxID=2635722 RepID=UPI000E08D371|nr:MULTISPECIES: DEAD/DEAH box helicase [unclassified Oceanispirochaeta]MBF9014366.1 DEAD/DEAH box helicase [Oceanispirochaeta sp. M2]NPD71252.1 DEAD/DEAH box helicase [Oceanispirochaeta sp. M1]RDG33637.1 ATP-dependent helicase [Oceanispirochaeta sp. M1]
MKILSPDFAEQFNPALLPEARGLKRENRVYNLKAEAYRLRVFVLGDQPMPFETELHHREDTLFWSCECSSTEPCVHLAALILKAGDEKFPEDHWFHELPVLEKESSFSSPDPQDSLQGDLFSFSSEPSGLREAPKRSRSRAPVPPEAAGIDDSASLTTSPSARGGIRAAVSDAAAVSASDDIPLFQGLSDDEFHIQTEAPRYDLVFTLAGNGETGIRVRPALLRLREGLRSGAILRYKVSRPISPLSNVQQDLLDKLCGSDESGEGGSMPLEECLHEVLAQDELFTSGRTPITVHKAASLETGFHFKELLHDDRPLYSPEYRFVDETGEILHRELKRSSIVLRNKRVFCLDEDSGNLAFLPEDSNTSFFVNLLLSKSQGFLPADIQGILRLTEKMSHHSLHLDENYSPVSVRKSSPGPVLKLRSRQDKTETFFFFRYGHQDVPYQSALTWIPPDLSSLKSGLNSAEAPVIVILKRDKDRESELVKKIVEAISDHLNFEKGYYAGLLIGNTEGDLRLDLSLEEFLAYYSKRLNALGVELQLEDRKISSAASVSFNVGNTTDWLEVDAMVEDPDTEELKKLFFDDHYQTLGLISTGDSYVKLSESDLRQLEYLRRQGMNDEGRLETSVRNFSVIDHIYEQIAQRDESPADDILEQARAIREASHEESFDQPEGLNATLRPYQKAGFNWLLRLHQTDCHGCLADDMGLGKTLQTLSLLQHLKTTGELKTSLLVAPVVTLANWENEITKFTPGLKSYRHGGSDRISEALHFKEYDLIIVSYHTLRNDVDLFLEFDFDYIILDEAHYIKNAGSRIFKAVRSLKSSHRLSLTGTPLENNSMELWSQFSFLNPGLLGSSKEFFNRFAQPIEKKKDKEALGILRDTVSPFMLRRKKEDVLKDLPPKEIIIHYSEMIPAQAELYNKYRDFYRARVKGLLDDKGLAGSSVEIFQFLLKLRQLAIYPPMTGDADAALVSSCKMEALKDLLDEVLTEDHKILIFSQFLGTLNAMADFCRDQHWDYSMITGKTTDRSEEIRRFQEDEDVRIFLLSLKAGGVGINLTAADYVVLFDPWWNPAAERQAIDRAHRMGQTRKVISYKMIVRDTIEEKILRMQEEKTALMDGILSDDSSVFTSMKEDEVLRLFE